MLDVARGFVCGGDAVAALADASCGILSVASFAGGVVLCAFVDELAGAGFLVAGVSLGLTCVAMRRVRLARSLSVTATRLRADVAVLADENDRLETASRSLQADLEVLKQTVGIVGEKSSDMLRSLHEVWRSYRAENDRQARLLDRQARLHVWQLIQHFDVDSDLLLTDAEMRAAVEYLRCAYPNARVDELGTIGMHNVNELLGVLRSGETGGGGDGDQPSTLSL